MAKGKGGIQVGTVARVAGAWTSARFERGKTWRPEAVCGKNKSAPQALKSLGENSKFAPSAAKAARFICRGLSRGLKPALPRINAGAPTAELNISSESFDRF